MIRTDVAIVGAGIVGASLAAVIARHADVVLLEGEDMPGRHSTGRSAAFWSETYGGPGVQPLTTASGPALREAGFLDPLGSLHIGRNEDSSAIDALITAFADRDVELIRVDPRARVPGLRDQWTLGILEPSCAYIDVAALHAAKLREARIAGADLMTDAALLSARRTGGRWSIETRAGAVNSAIIVDAAGAWADEVAERCGVAPIGITSYRRTMLQIGTDPPPPAAMPHVSDIRGRFYFKPETGGRLWLSPHDETRSPPCDTAPEEIDVAIAIDRFERVVDWRVLAVERKWAGLRNFAPDRLPVYGFDPAAPGFFWCAGQGGFGIQTAPAGSALAGAILLGSDADDFISHIDLKCYAPDRFRTVKEP